MSKLLPVEPSPYRKEITEDVIQILKDLLSQAEQGNVTGLSVAYISPGGYSNSRASKTDNCTQLLGIMHLQAYRYAKTCDE